MTANQRLKNVRKIAKAQVFEGVTITETSTEIHTYIYITIKKQWHARMFFLFNRLENLYFFNFNYLYIVNM